MPTRRQFLIGSAAGLIGCASKASQPPPGDGAPSDVPTPDPLPPLPTNATWMYFKGNGHESGRNGPYDHVPVQRFFSIPTLENTVDTLPWAAGFSVCWQLIPVRQAGYYTTFFYAASQDTDFFDLRDTHGYVGAHGAAQIWWGKISPQTPDDLASDFIGVDGQRRVATWADAARCEIVAHADLPDHHAFQAATAIGDLSHMERG